MNAAHIAQSICGMRKSLWQISDIFLIWGFFNLQRAPLPVLLPTQTLHQHLENTQLRRERGGSQSQRD